MEIIQFNLPGTGIPDIVETVYDSLLGQLVTGYALPWVENIFVPGHPCYEEYCKMRRAYERLLSRLQEIDEAPDIEIMIDALLQHGKLAAMEMFRYGRAYQKRLDTEL